MTQNINLNIVGTANFLPAISEIKKLKTAMYDLQNTQIGKGLNTQLNAQLKSYEQDFLKVIQTTKGFNVEQVKLADATDHLTTKLSRGQFSLGEYYSMFKRSRTGVVEELNQIAQAQAKVAKSFVIPSQKGGYAQVITDMSGVADKMKTAQIYQKALNTAMMDGTTKLINFGKNTQWAGRQLTVGLTVPLMAAGGAMAAMFYQVDQNLRKMQAVYGVGGKAGGAFSSILPSQQEIASIRTQVVQLSQEMARTYGQTAQETAGVAADLAAAGYTGNSLLGLTKTVTKAMVLGESDRQTAMKATIALQSAYKLSTDETATALNFFSAAQAATSTTMRDLIDAIPRVGPVVRNLGGSYKDTVAMLVAMKEGGVAAGEGANALKNSLGRLISPTKTAVDSLKVFGVDILGIVNKNSGNVVGMIEALQQALSKLTPLARQQAITDIFGKFQMSRMTALLDNFNQSGTQSAKVMQMMGLSAKQLSDIAANQTKTLQESTSGQFKIAIETLKADLMPIGETFLQVATILVKAVDFIVKGFEKLGPIKYVLGGILGGAAVLGPLIMFSGLMANLVGQVFKLVQLFRMFRGGFAEGGGWSSPIKSLTTAFAGLSNYFQEVDKAMVASEALSKDLNATMMKQEESLNILTAALTRYTNAIARAAEINGVSGGGIVPPPNGPSGGPVGPGGMPFVPTGGPTSPIGIIGNATRPTPPVLNTMSVNKSGAGEDVGRTGFVYETPSGNKVKGNEFIHLVTDKATQNVLGNLAVVPGYFDVPNSPGVALNRNLKENPMPIVPPSMMQDEEIVKRVLRDLKLSTAAWSVEAHAPAMSLENITSSESSKIAMLRAMQQMGPSVLPQLTALHQNGATGEDVHNFFSNAMGPEQWQAMRKQAVQDVLAAYESAQKSVHEELIANGRGSQIGTTAGLQSVTSQFGSELLKEYKLIIDNMDQQIVTALTVESEKTGQGLSTAIREGMRRNAVPALINLGATAATHGDLVVKEFENLIHITQQAMAKIASQVGSTAVEVAAMSGVGTAPDINQAAARVSRIEQITRGGLGAVRLATGGKVQGPGGPKDDVIPAMLSDGEYVVNANAVGHYGTGFLDAVNTKKLAGGGPAGSRFAGIMDSLFGREKMQSSSQIEKYLNSSRSAYTGHNIEDFFASRKGANNVDLKHIEDLISNHQALGTLEEQQLMKALEEHASGDWGNKGPLAQLSPEVVNAGRASLDQRLSQMPGDTVRLYRAIRTTPETGKTAPGHYGYIPAGQAIEAHQPYTSYSSDIEKAMTFVGNGQIANARIIEVDVPKSAIVGIQNANYTGKPGEGEFVVRTSDIPGGSRYVTFTGLSTTRKNSDDPLLKFLAKPGAESKGILLQDIARRYTQMPSPEASSRVPGFWDESQRQYAETRAGNFNFGPRYSPQHQLEFFGITPEEVQIARQHLEEKYGMQVKELAKQKNKKIIGKNYEDQTLLRLASDNGFITAEAPGTMSTIWSPNYINRATGGGTGQFHHNRFYQYHPRKFKYATGGMGSPAPMDTYMRFSKGGVKSTKPAEKTITKEDANFNNKENLTKHGNLPPEIAEIVANSAQKSYQYSNTLAAASKIRTEHVLLQTEPLLKPLKKPNLKDYSSIYEYKKAYEEYKKDLKIQHQIIKTNNFPLEPQLLSVDETKAIQKYIRNLYNPPEQPSAEVIKDYLTDTQLNPYKVVDLLGIQHGHLQGKLGKGDFEGLRPLVHEKTGLGVGTVASTAAENQIFAKLSLPRGAKGGNDLLKAYDALTLDPKTKEIFDEIIKRNGQAMTYEEAVASRSVLSQLTNSSNISSRYQLMLRQAVKSYDERINLGKDPRGNRFKYSENMADRTIASMNAKGIKLDSFPELRKTFTKLFNSKKPGSDQARDAFMRGLYDPTNPFLISANPDEKIQRTSKNISGDYLLNPLNFLRNLGTTPNPSDGKKEMKGEYSRALIKFMKSVARRLEKGGIAKLADGGVPALVSNGEYFFGPDVVQHYGKGFMDNLNAGKFAMGGKIVGPGGPKDDLIPMTLPEHSYIINAAATQKIGTPALDAINSKRFNRGGFLGFAGGGSNDIQEFKLGIAKNAFNANETLQVVHQANQAELEVFKQRRASAAQELQIAKQINDEIRRDASATAQEKTQAQTRLKEARAAQYRADMDVQNQQKKISQSKVAAVKAEKNLQVAADRAGVTDIAMLGPNPPVAPEEKSSLRQRVKDRYNPPPGEKRKAFKAEMGSMMAGTALQMVGSMAGGALESNAGGPTMMSQAANFAGTGAMLGSMLGPEGIAIGAVGGAIVGGFMGRMSENQRALDAATARLTERNNGLIASYKASDTTLQAFGITLRKLSDIRLGKTSQEVDINTQKINQMADAYTSSTDESQIALNKLVKESYGKDTQDILKKQFYANRAAGMSAEDASIAIAALAKANGKAGSSVQTLIDQLNKQDAAWEKSGNAQAKAALAALGEGGKSNGRIPKITDVKNFQVAKDLGLTTTELPQGFQWKNLEQYIPSDYGGSGKKTSKTLMKELFGDTLFGANGSDTFNKGVTGQEILNAPNADAVAIARLANVKISDNADRALGKIWLELQKIGAVGPDALIALGGVQQQFNTISKEFAGPISDAISNFDPKQFKEFVNGLNDTFVGKTTYSPMGKYGAPSATGGSTFAKLNETGKMVLDQIASSLDDSLKPLYESLKGGPGSVTNFLSAVNLVSNGLVLKAGQIAAITNDKSGTLLAQATAQAGFEQKGKDIGSTELGNINGANKVNDLQEAAQKSADDFAAAQALAQTAYQKEQQSIQDTIKAKGKYIDSIRKEMDARQKLFDKKQQAIQQDLTLRNLQNDVYKARTTGSLLDQAAAQSAYNAELNKQADLKKKQAADEKDQSKIDKTNEQVQKLQDTLDANSKTYDKNQKRDQATQDADQADYKTKIEQAKKLGDTTSVQQAAYQYGWQKIVAEIETTGKVGDEEITALAKSSGLKKEAITQDVNDLKQKYTETIGAFDTPIVFGTNGTMTTLNVPGGVIHADEITGALTWEPGGPAQVLKLGDLPVYTAPTKPQTIGSGPLANKPLPPLTAAVGGYISGPGTGTSDSIPARLSDGEYVVRANAVKHYGAGMMNAINTKKFANGGMAKLNDGEGGVSTSENSGSMKPASDQGGSTSSQQWYAPVSAKTVTNGLYYLRGGHHAEGWWGKNNSGVNDIHAGLGTPFRSLLGGVVTYVGKAPQDKFYLPGYVKVRNNIGGEERYAHMIPSVSVGQKVAAGQTLGVAGVQSTPVAGRTMTSPHLHFAWHDFAALIQREAGGLVPWMKSNGKPVFDSYGTAAPSEGDSSSKPTASSKIKGTLPKINLGFSAPFADGGKVAGLGGPKDDLIPAMLSNGEYVVNAKSVSKYGKNFLDMVNAGKFNPKFTSPSSRTGTPKGISDTIGATTNNVEYNLSVTVEKTNASPEDIANVVIQTLKRKEKTNKTHRIL